MLGGRRLGVPVRFWDGSTLGARPDAAATIVVRSPTALQHLLFAPGELGLGRAFVSGALDVEGDIYAALDIRLSLAEGREPLDLRFDAVTIGEAWRAARALG